MFINARPSSALNDFCPFVPSQIVELPYNWPYSMTDRWGGAWGNLRPVAPSAVAPGPWTYRFDEANNVESYSDPLAHNFFPGPYEATQSYSKPQQGNKSVPAAPRMVECPQMQSTNVTQFKTQSSYGLQEIQASNPETNISQHDANINSYGCNTGHPIGNLSGFSKAECSFEEIALVDQPNLDIDDATSMSSSTGGPSFSSIYDASVACDSFVGNDIGSDGAYQSPFERDVDRSSVMAVSYTAPAVQRSFNSCNFWDEVETRISHSTDPCGMALSFSYDGLPNALPALWPSQSEQSPTWSHQRAPPGTVSPQALSLVAPSTSSKPHDNSPRSSSEQLSMSSARPKVQQKSSSNISYPVSQSKRPRSVNAQDYQIAIPHTRLKSARSAPVNTLQIQTFDDSVPDPKAQNATLQRLQVSQFGDNASIAVDLDTVEGFHLDRVTDDRLRLAARSSILQVTSVNEPAGKFLPREIGSVTSHGFLMQKTHSTVQKSKSRTLRPRRKLPSGRFGEKFVSPIPDNVDVPSKPCKEVSMTDFRELNSRSDGLQGAISTIRQCHKKTSSVQRPFKSKKIEAKILERQIANITTDTKRTPSLTATKDTTQQRIAKDKFLLDAKRSGKSYKQIRLQGGFTEAESTLRGRHRTLTKKPEERVRKPEWERNDLRLLKKAVRKFAEDPNLARPQKVSWKEVSDYIVENGGSYRFGNSTCRKKWSELFVASSDQDLS